MIFGHEIEFCHLFDTHNIKSAVCTRCTNASNANINSMLLFPKWSTNKANLNTVHFVIAPKLALITLDTYCMLQLISHIIHSTYRSWWVKLFSKRIWISEENYRLDSSWVTICMWSQQYWNIHSLLNNIKIGSERNGGWCTNDFSKNHFSAEQKLSIILKLPLLNTSNIQYCVEAYISHIYFQHVQIATNYIYTLYITN